MNGIKEQLMRIGCEEQEAEALYERYKQAGRLGELEEYTKAKTVLIGYKEDDCRD